MRINFRPLKTAFISSFAGWCMMMPLTAGAQLTDPAEIWDSIKAQAMPEIAPGFIGNLGIPEKMPVSDYGWEDGLQISGDGLNIYALYSPSDLLTWTDYIVTHAADPVCTTLGNTSFLRHYAGTYGMDLATNFFGCDSAINIDILYAHRNSIADPFTTWTLSGIARPGLNEGGPFPLVSTGDPEHVDHFLFTGNGDIWMINNTTINPSGIAGAIRLPAPINPVTNEFVADNPILKRMHESDTLLLIYEKYTDPAVRDFMYAFSYNDGDSWESPMVITTIINDLGHIEHPQLFSNATDTWMYYSLNYDIYRAHQAVAGNWDSWENIEPVILKGNCLAIGEPSITDIGDIAFVAAYQNATTTHPNDKLDADPWMVKNIEMESVENTATASEIVFFPNPAALSVTLHIHGNTKAGQLIITDLQGREVMHINSFISDQSIDISGLLPGIYLAKIISGNTCIAAGRLMVLSK